jgi:serine/threonine protein kinase
MIIRTSCAFTLSWRCPTNWAWCSNIEGETLSQVLARKHRLPFDEVREYLKPVCDALQHAHKHGIYHRDIKPSNIMIKADGVVKVMDFGIAREAKSAMTTLTNTVMGTPPYMAPEMELGVVSKEGDVYSLGVTLYELLSGETLFCGASATYAKRSMNFRPLSSFIPGLPVGIDEFIVHALQPERVRRIRSVDNFLAGLDKLSIAAKAPATEGARRITRINEITPS